MVVKVLSKLQQALSWLLPSQSLVGDSMLVRLRNGIIGLLGLVAAVGLGLTVLVALQGWPGVSRSPLPTAPEPPFARNDTISLRQTVPQRLAAAVSEARRPDSGGRQSAKAQAPEAVSEPTVSRGVAEPEPAPPASPVAPDAPSSPPDEPPPAAPVTAPSAPAQAPASQPTAVPVVAGSEDVSPGRGDKSRGKSGKSHGYSSHAPGPPSGAGHDDDYDNKGDGDTAYDKGDEKLEEDRDYDGKGDDGAYDDRGRRGKPD